MGMSIRTKNILTVFLAVVILGGFIFLAEGLKKDNKDDRLAAIENATTTTVRRTTTTREVTTTTSSTVPSTTSSSALAVVTTTTVKKTTTTRAATTPTTVSNFAAIPHNGGPGTEASDNTGSFTRADSSITGARAPECVRTKTDPFCFQLGWINAGGKLEINLLNNTAREVKFPGGLQIIVTVNRPNNTQSQFSVGDKSVTTISSGEHLSVTSPAAGEFLDNGNYTFTATCNVDYG